MTSTSIGDAPPHRRHSGYISAVAAHQPVLKASAVMYELMDVCGGCPEPAHTALGYTIIVTGERYKLGA